MKRFHASFIALLVFGSVWTTAFAGDSATSASERKPLNSGAAYSRLCVERDLRGLWRVVKWTPFMEVKGADWRESLFLRHQWFEFDGNGRLKTVASNKKMPLEKAVSILAKAPWAITISFKRDGFCVISSESKKYPNSIWRCAVITKDIKIESRKLDLKKGDIVMTLFDDEENILYFRQMRKAKPGGDG